MDGDLLGNMAFAAPANESASQTQPTPPTLAMDLLSGPPIKTKEQAPTESPINNLQTGQDNDADGDGVSQSPFSDDPTEFQTQAQSEPQKKQQSTANSLMDFRTSAAAYATSDLDNGASNFSDGTHSTSDPFAPPSQQSEWGPSFDLFSDQPVAVHPDPFAPPTKSNAVDNGFAAFSDQSPQPATPDLFGTPFPPEANGKAVISPAYPFAPVEQSDETPAGAKTSDMLGDVAAASEQSSASIDAVEKSGNGNQLVEIQSVERTATHQTGQDDKDETSELENTTNAAASVPSPLETTSEMAETANDPPSNSARATAQLKPETPPSIKEVPTREEVGPTMPEEITNYAPDLPAADTTETSKNESDSSNDSKEALVGQSQSKQTEPSMPQNGSDDKSENSKSEAITEIPARGQTENKASSERPGSKNNATTNDAKKEVPKAQEPTKAIPPIKMGIGNQKLDFGMASNMFRSFSSISGAQLKQLQSKGGVTLKVGLSKLGEASSNLAGTIKQKNAVSNVFKAEDTHRSANMQHTGSQEPSTSEVEKKEDTSKEGVSETSTPTFEADEVAVSTSLEEKKDEVNVIENEQDRDTKAPKVPHPKSTSATSANTTGTVEMKTTIAADSGAEPATATTQTKVGGKFETKDKDIKHGMTASAVTSLFGLKIEKLPIATMTSDKTKINEQDEKKSMSKNTSPYTTQSETDYFVEQNRFVAENKSENGAPVDDAKKDTASLEENPKVSQKEQDIAPIDVESKATIAIEFFEEKKQEPFDIASSSDGEAESAEVNSAQSEENNAKFPTSLAALENELRASSSKEIQTLKKELQASREDSAQQIQALQKELQSSKDGSSRLIKSLEKKLHSSQEAVKQLKDKSTKLQQGAEENELKKDLIEDLNSKLQIEMSKRQESEATSKKTTEKLDKVVEQFNTLQKTSKERLLQMKGTIDKLVQSNKKMEEEIIGIREERDEQGRRLSSNTTQLNEAKKNEAIKVNAAEHYELKVNELDEELKQTKDKMAQMKFERDRFRKELGNWKKYAEDRNKQLEGQLKHEKKLNEERKRRMKLFVEAKTEEARSSNVENVSLQAELDQTTRSLKDFNQRYKQLHNQWVQAQARNRELQRDMTKMKNDSEKMSKVGGSLEAKLSRYSKEIEDHKSKRLAAKNELMTVIAKLEEEKQATTRLRNFIKRTIIPKVLLQHQLLQESAEHFEGGLRQLALRFGREFSSLRRKAGSKPNPLADWKPKTLEEIQSMVGDVNTAHILSKLEDETQRVNEQVSNVSASVEQLESLLVAPTTKGCVGAMFGTF